MHAEHVRYDKNGNMTSRGGSAITWTSFNQPLRINAGAYYSEFSYNANHQRWKQLATAADGTTTTRYIGGILEKLDRPGGVTEYRHLIPAGSGTVIYLRKPDGSNTTTYLTTDHLGSGDLILDSAGAVLARMSFTPFGARRGSNWQGTPTSADYTTFANKTRRGFTGHEMLDALGLVHMNGRVYDPLIGRFLSADPIIQTISLSQALNPYSYVMNNPLTLIDPSGYSWLSKLFSNIGKFLKKFWRPLLAIAIAVFMPPLLVKAIGEFAAAVVAGMVAGGVATGTMNGALLGGLTAGLFYGAGTLARSIGAKAGGLGHAALHAAAGCASAAAGGGSCGKGALSAAFADIAGVRTPEAKGALAKAVKYGALGGGAAVLAGGRFGEGFTLGMAGYLYNDRIHLQERAEKLAAEISARGEIGGKGEADWLYQINSDPSLSVTVDASRLTVTSDGNWAFDPNGGMRSTGYVNGDDYWVHGQVTIRARPDGSFGIYDQPYHFGMHNDSSWRGIFRNLATFGGSPGGGWPNTSYWIRYKGNVNITNPD